MEEKSSDIAAIPELLDKIQVKDAEKPAGGQHNRKKRKDDENR